MAHNPIAHAKDIWQAAVDAVQPEVLVADALRKSPILKELRRARRILVLGGGKAGAAMSAAVEDALDDMLDHIEGLVNVPAETCRPLAKIRLHPARPSASNQPTLQGVVGAEEILRLAREAGHDDVALCLLSGGGSALLPAPAPGVTLAAKQQVTQLLHTCGASINEMNTVRKHLSAIKGGRLAQTFAGKSIHSLIISDVVGDPLDVIASGPTAADPTTFADALAVLDKFALNAKVPETVVDHLQRGTRGEYPETLKTLPECVHNVVIGNNVKALAAAEARAKSLGYRVLNLGSYLEGDTGALALHLAALVTSVREQGVPFEPPVCIVSGGETTVTLPPDHGKGGRNQQFVLATLVKLGLTAIDNVVVLSGGTDGEDGPTDAAGGCADESTLLRAAELSLDPTYFLTRSDAYPFLSATGSLFTTGLTQTNVMDVRVILIGKQRRV